MYIYIYISRCLLLFFFFSCTRNDYTFMVLQLGSGFFLSADSIGRGEDPRFRERLSPSKFALSSLPSAYVHLFHARWNIEGKQLAYSIRGKEILVKFPSPWRNALRNLGLALHRKYWWIFLPIKCPSKISSKDFIFLTWKRGLHFRFVPRW